jgi:hypothetical protein
MGISTLCSTIILWFPVSFLNLERKAFATCFETSAEFETEPLILICRELFSDFSALTTVVTPRLRETPAPFEPFFRLSADWSNIWNTPVMWLGAKALAPFVLCVPHVGFNVWV